MQAVGDLQDARESLAYWEDRARRLPRRAIRRRREARAMAVRWRERVSVAEREAYGRGLLGLLLLVLFERRLPARTRHTGRLVARRTAQVAAVVVVSLLVLAVAVVVAAIELLGDALSAL